MKLLSIIAVFLILQTGNPNLDQDIIYPKAAEVKIGNGETCEIINEKKMLKAKDILHTYWNKNISDSTWTKYNRQYMIYNSIQMGTVVYINGACLEKPADFYKKTWCLGMAKAECYFTAFVDLKKKNVVSFKWNTYDK